MTQITPQDLKRLSRLSRIAIDEDSQEIFIDQVSRVLSWVENLGKIDTDGVEPMNNPFDGNLRMEKDEITDGDIQKDILKNAPAGLYGYFSVPKVIE